MTEPDFTEFLKNEKFIRWVTNPNTELDHYWKHWISSHPERKTDMELARSFLNSIEYKKQFKLGQTAYQKSLYELIKLHESEAGKRKLISPVFWKMTGIAAMVVFALILGRQLDWLSTTSEGQATTELQEVIKQTELGQRRKVRLPDGSFVHLNAGSKLTYTLPFDQATRKVHLSGEAFFDVYRDVERPFIIASGSLETKVLGTSFNVKAYPEEEETSVAVVTGKVEVSSGNGRPSIILNSSEEVTYDNEIKKMNVSGFDPQDVIGWRDDIIRFKETSMDEVFSRLERWYGVEFIISNHVRLKGKYSGVYHNTSLEQVLDGVGLTSGFDYELRGKRVTIKPKNNDQ